MAKMQGRIQQISEQLCEEFQRILPLQPPVKTKRGKHPSEAAVRSSSEVALKQFYEVAYNERQRHGLGLIGRARVAFELQQRLLQAGYPAPLVKQVLFALLVSAFVGGK